MKGGRAPVLAAVFRNMNPKRRFTLLLLLIHGIALPTISVLTYVVVRQNAVQNAYSTGRLYLSGMTAIKHYVAEELRPVFYREMPGRFIVQGMSRTYVATHIASRIMQELPNYRYKNASLNPMNPQNRADEFERAIINHFVSERINREWRSLVSKDGEDFYVIARPGDPFAPDCLRCHGNPEDAPRELIDIYGTKSGFHHAENDLTDAAFVYIPIGVPLAAARRAVMIFIGLYVAVGTIILAVINVRFAKLYAEIEDARKRVEDINVEVMTVNHDMEAIISERSMNLLALSVADKVRNPITAIGGTLRRLLKKELLAPSLKERIQEIIGEAEKLEAIVRDYETILQTRQMMFKMENLNELVESTLPMIGDEQRRKGISLSLRLSETSPRFMANRSLLRVSILHLLKNAVEAVAEGGAIEVSTAVQGDRIVLSIIDNGTGISDEAMPNIFQLFYSSKRRGMGMGLPIAKQIVEEHKGVITAESVPGRTVFRIEFPARWSEKELSGGVL